MDVTKVEMNPVDADAAFRQYRAAFMADRNRIDGELMRGYKALAQGKTLISLTEAIRTGGLDAVGRPRIAIARADEEDIEMWVAHDGTINYDPWVRNVKASDRLFEVNPGLNFAATLPRFHHWHAGLPFIPPQFRPPHALSNYHLLWEATWLERPRSQVLDPMLLRRIGGDVFAVVAAWDLTPLEKLILAR